MKYLYLIVFIFVFKVDVLMFISNVLNYLDVMIEEFIYVNINLIKVEKFVLIFINWWYIVLKCKSVNSI